ncbi:MAG TPA: hypothetical protein VMU26_14675 [Candidatus Polarisedimenticolia bacterium]|nr:hypothetical protein [Candidatus Polarisedimenticolia bacterium]
MNELLARILDAHGGLERWNGYKKVDATIVSGGGFFPLKGVPQDPSPCHMTAWYTRNARQSGLTGLPISGRCSRQIGLPSKNSMAK